MVGGAHASCSFFAKFGKRTFDPSGETQLKRVHLTELARYDRATWHTSGVVRMRFGLTGPFQFILFSVKAALSFFSCSGHCSALES